MNSITVEVQRSSADLNCSGEADAADALFALQVLAGLIAADAQCPADANKDSAFDIRDVLHIRLDVARLTTPLQSLFP